MNDFEPKTDVADVSTGAELSNGPASLVVIYTPLPELLGKRFMLGPEGLEIGRGSGCQVVLSDEAASRRHCCLEQRDGSWHVKDAGSTNGTLLNGRILSVPARLTHNDRVQVGRTVLKFLAGAGEEAKYHEEIYRLAIFDGLTGVHNRRYFEQTLESEVRRVNKHGRNLCVAMLELDHHRRLVDENGSIYADALINELADRMQIRIGIETLARYGEFTFALLIPETALSAAAERVDPFLQCAKGQFKYMGEGVAPTLSIGVAAHLPGETALALIERANQALHQAKEKGGNQIHTVGPNQHVRRYLSGRKLLSKLLSFSGSGTTASSSHHLVAFEIGNEADILMMAGTEAYDQCYRELIADVEANAPADATAGRWKDRYVLLAVAGSGAAATEVRLGITRAWERRGALTGGSTSVSRVLHSALLTPRDLAQHGKRSLDALLTALLQNREERDVPSPRISDLPYPLAVFGAIVSSRQTTLARVATLNSALETILRFIVALEVAWLREWGTDDARDELIEFVSRLGPAGRKLGMGDWEELSWRLAQLLPADAPDAVAAAASALRSGHQRSRLSERLRSAVTLRNAIAHGATRADDAYAAEEVRLQEILHELLEAMAPLANTRLISCCSSRFLGEDEGFSCEVRTHQGPLEHFSVGRLRRTEPLPSDWCCLVLDPKPGASLLCLAPFIISRACDTCGRVEVFVTESLRLGPKGTKMVARGITTSHESRVELPGLRSLRELYERQSRKTNTTARAETPLPVEPIGAGSVTTDGNP